MNRGWPSVSRNVRASAASSSGCSATSPASCAVACLVERTERDPRQQIIALEVIEQPSERRIVLLFLRAYRADHEAARVGGRAQEIVEPFDRVRIRPLQVVNHEDERSRRPEYLRQRLEEAHALPALELMVRGSHLGARREQLGMQPCDVRQPGRIQPHQRRLQRLALQPGRDRRVRQAPFPGITARGHRVDALGTAPVDQFFGEPALADARFTPDQEELRPTSRGASARR